MLLAHLSSAEASPILRSSLQTLLYKNLLYCRFVWPSRILILNRPQPEPEEWTYKDSWHPSTALIQTSGLALYITLCVFIVCRHRQGSNDMAAWPSSKSDQNDLAIICNNYPVRLCQLLLTAVVTCTSTLEEQSSSLAGLPSNHLGRYCSMQASTQELFKGKQRHFQLRLQGRFKSEPSQDKFAKPQESQLWLNWHCRVKDLFAEEEWFWWVSIN